ncbi:LPXTG cell wall anchor domain-containing protein [Vagococcus carniphilus]|uniref:LPXTG cell wall anchor domain-containing protein n=1 Tax=Vagococcus carniphilus TaxID=218144 RepID=UPI003BACDBDD
MKKRMLGFVLVGSLMLGFGIGTRAEEAVVNKTDENVAAVVNEDVNKEEGETSEPVKQVDPPKQVDQDVAAQKMIAKRKIESLNDTDAKDKVPELLSRLEKAVTMEEVQAISSEADQLWADYALAIEVNSYKNTIRDLQKLNKITKEKADELIAKLDNAKTVQEAKDIFSEVAGLIDGNAFVEKRDKLTSKVNDLMKQGKLTKEQGDKFLGQIEVSRYSAELEIIEAEVDKQVKLNETSGEGSFKEKYAAIENSIKQYVEQNKLTKEQGDNFLAKLKKCQTIDELNALSNEIEKQVKDNEASKTTTTKPKSILPQTGEKQTIMSVVIGLVFLLGVGVVFFKKRQRKS